MYAAHQTPTELIISGRSPSPFIAHFPAFFSLIQDAALMSLFSKDQRLLFLSVQARSELKHLSRFSQDVFCDGPGTAGRLLGVLRKCE